MRSITVHTLKSGPLQVYSTTSTKRTLLCQARNPDGTVEDKHFFIVNSEFFQKKILSALADLLNGDGALLLILRKRRLDYGMNGNSERKKKAWKTEN